MKMLKDEPNDIGYSHKVTLTEAVELKRYDWIVFLVKQWRVKK